MKKNKDKKALKNQASGSCCRPLCSTHKLKPATQQQPSIEPGKTTGGNTLSPEIKALIAAVKPDQAIVTCGDKHEPQTHFVVSCSTGKYSSKTQPLFHFKVNNQRITNSGLFNFVLCTDLDRVKTSQFQIFRYCFKILKPGGALVLATEAVKECCSLISTKKLFSTATSSGLQLPELRQALLMVGFITVDFMIEPPAVSCSNTCQTIKIIVVANKDCKPYEQ